MDPARNGNNSMSHRDHDQSSFNMDNVPPAMRRYVGNSVLSPFTVSPPRPVPSSVATGSSFDMDNIPPSMLKYIGKSDLPTFTVPFIPSSVATGSAFNMDIVPLSMRRYVNQGNLPTFTMGPGIPPSVPTASSSHANGAPTALDTAGLLPSNVNGTSDATASSSLNVHGAPGGPAPSYPDQVYSPSLQLAQLAGLCLNLPATPSAYESQRQQNEVQPPAENVPTPGGHVVARRERRNREEMLPIVVRAFRSVATGRMVVKEIYDYVIRNCRQGEYRAGDPIWEKNVRHLLTKKKFFELTDKKLGKAKYWQFREDVYRETQATGYRARFVAPTQHGDDSDEEEEDEQIMNVPDNGQNGTDNISNNQSSSFVQPSSNNIMSLEAQLHPTRPPTSVVAHDMQNNAATFSGVQRVSNSNPGMSMLAEDHRNYAANAYASNFGNFATPPPKHPIMKDPNNLMFGMHSTDYTQGSSEPRNLGTTRGNASADLHTLNIGMSNDNMSQNQMQQNTNTLNENYQGTPVQLRVKASSRSTKKPYGRQNGGNTPGNFRGNAGNYSDMATNGMSKRNPASGSGQQMSWNINSASAAGSSSQMNAYDWNNQIPAANTSSHAGGDFQNNSGQHRSHAQPSGQMTLASNDQFNSPVQLDLHDLRNTPVQHRPTSYDPPNVSAQNDLYNFSSTPKRASYDQWNASAQSASYGRRGAPVQHASSGFGNANATVQRASHDLHNSNATVQLASHDLRNVNATFQRASYDQANIFRALPNTATGRSSSGLTDRVQQSSQYAPDTEDQRFLYGMPNASYQSPVYDVPVQRRMPNTPSFYDGLHPSVHRSFSGAPNTLNQRFSHDERSMLGQSSSYDVSNTFTQRSSDDLTAQRSFYSSNTSGQRSSHDASNPTAQYSSYSSNPSGQRSSNDLAAQRSLYSSNPSGQRSSHDASIAESVCEPGMNPDGSIDFTHPRWTNNN